MTKDWWSNYPQHIWKSLLLDFQNFNILYFSGSARLLAATTLRNVLGTMNLGEILSQRESIAREMRVRNRHSHELWDQSNTMMITFFWTLSKLMDCNTESVACKDKIFHKKIFEGKCNNFVLGDSWWSHWTMGSEGWESWGEGCESACPVDESHGCWGWSC